MLLEITRTSKFNLYTECLETSETETETGIRNRKKRQAKGLIECKEKENQGIPHTKNLNSKRAMFQKGVKDD